MRSIRAWAVALCTGLGLVGCPAPPRSPPTAPKESPRMTLDDTLQRAAGSDFDAYRPRLLVDAVNALVPLGKDGALAAIEAFLDARDLDAEPHHGLFLVLRVLFEVDAEAHPPLRLGSSLPPPPDRPAALPRFPIVLVDDLPLLLVAGYDLGGDSEPVTAHIAYYRRHGALRAGPLAPAPTPAAERMAKLEQLYRAAYGRDPSAAERGFLGAQLASVGP
jgi:hypothetical protein